jgi:hypothetical protein
MGLLFLLAETVLLSYSKRSLPPRVEETTNIVFAIAEPVLALGLVLLQIPASPTAVGMLLRYSKDPAAAGEFLQGLSVAAIAFLGHANQNGQGQSNPADRLYPSLHAFVGAMRAAWANR